MLRQFFQRSAPRDGLAPLYEAIVAEARRPGWYREGGVPDSVDGRFDMVASVLSLVLLRLEREGAQTRHEQTLLTETFVSDMDGELRQMGIGDLMVGKHVGKMMGALGGRLTAYRDALAGRGDLGEAIRRNVFRDDTADPDRVGYVEGGFRRLWADLDRASVDELLGGRLAG